MPALPSFGARRFSSRRLRQLMLLSVLLCAAAGLRVAVAATAVPAAQPASRAHGSPGPSAPSPTPAHAAGQTAATSGAGGALDEQVQSLKSQVLDLNRDLFVLEQELLYPANTQVAVFVSMDAGKLFSLDSVQLKIDDKEVANYLYTPREAAALAQGGVQRLYVGNLKAGRHELVAFFTGKGPHGRDYTRGASLQFQKDIGAKYLELSITDSQRKLQPEFKIRDWE